MSENNETEMRRVSLTEQQEEKVGRLMIQAALDALGESPSSETEKLSRRVVRALSAAEKTRKSERERFNDALKVSNEWVNVHVDAEKALAVAFWLWLDDCSSVPQGWSVDSAVGGLLLKFVQGLEAARSMTVVLSMLDDGDDPYCMAESGAVYMEETLDLTSDDDS